MVQEQAEVHPYYRRRDYWEGATDIPYATYTCHRSGSKYPMDKNSVIVVDATTAFVIAEFKENTAEELQEFKEKRTKESTFQQ